MTLYRVSAQSLEVLGVGAADARVSAQSLEVLTSTWQLRLPKAYALAVLGPNPAAVALQKAYALAVIDDGSLPTYDQHWSNTVLLCHFDDGVGLVDSSPSAHTLTSAAANILTFPKFGTGSVNLYGGTSYVATADNLTDFQFGSGQFTIEAWAWFSSVSGSDVQVIAGNFSAAPDLGWLFRRGSTGLFGFSYTTTGTGSVSVQAAWTPTINQWYHVAVDRDASNVLRVYIDGAVHASATVSATLWPSTSTLYIGNDGNVSRGVLGYLDDVRITKGIARYGGAFAVPQAAFPDTGSPSLTARRRPVVAFLG